MEIVSNRAVVVRWTVLAAALALLNLSLTFVNVWPTLFVRLTGAVSADTALLVLVMVGIRAWLGPPSRTVLRMLGVLWVVLVVGRYADVTSRSLYGRDINLYWDVRYMPDVGSMLAVVAEPWMVAVVVAGEEIVVLRSADELDAGERIALRSAAESGSGQQADAHALGGVGVVQHVGAVAAVDIVGPAAAEDEVIAAVAEDRVVAAVAHDQVGAAAAEDRVVAATAIDPVAGVGDAIRLIDGFGGVRSLDDIDVVHTGKVFDAEFEDAGAMIAMEPVGSAQQHVSVPKVTTPGIFAGVQHGAGRIGHIGDPRALSDGLADSL